MQLFIFYDLTVCGYFIFVETTEGQVIGSVKCRNIDYS